MKLVLSGLKTLEVQSIETGHSVSDESSSEKKMLDVEFCGVCRTDAKMFYEGQRDLIFPRVMGHELVISDGITGKHYTVWPGESCEECEHCASGREHLCENIRILGFHFDGGYSHRVAVDRKNLIELGELTNPAVGTFAEPMGCLINIFSNLDPETDSPIIIYGGGTLGLMAAFYTARLGIESVIIEKDEEKIAIIKPAAECAGARVLKDTPESDFASAINTCADNIAFARSLSKLRKGGKLFYFSGVKKNENVTTNLLNLVHYRELKIFGGYGLSRKHMITATRFISENEYFFEMLIHKSISLSDLASVMPLVIKGKSLKYIVDTGLSPGTDRTLKSIADVPDQDLIFGDKLKSGWGNITAIPDDRIRKAKAKMDDKAKPLGGFGTIEKLAVKISSIRNSLQPVLENKMVLVFAGDHGICEEGVSAYPQEVTKQMVGTFLKGKAAINVLCENYGLELRVIDMGVNHLFNDDLRRSPMFIDKKIRMGSRNMALEPALTEWEANESIKKGMEVFEKIHQEENIDILGLGEIGIGNTSSASAIICAVTGMDVEMVTGRGTGIDDKVWKHKVETLQKVLDYQNPSSVNGIDILRKVGGYEIAGMTGAALAAASAGIPVVLDGLISTSAGLVAGLLNPLVLEYFIAGHKSVEPGHMAAFKYMGLEAVLDLSMRLGEGTGAALTINLCETACSVMRNMASFDEAGICPPVTI